jgi:hypothetical protein
MVITTLGVDGCSVLHYVLEGYSGNCSIRFKHLDMLKAFSSLFLFRRQLIDLLGG